MCFQIYIGANNLLNPSLSPVSELRYSADHYKKHLERLDLLTKQYRNLDVQFISKLPQNTLLYIKERVGVIMIKQDSPQTMFVITESNMSCTFRDYVEKCMPN